MSVESKCDGTLRDAYLILRALSYSQSWTCLFKSRFRSQPEPRAFSRPFLFAFMVLSISF